MATARVNTKLGSNHGGATTSWEVTEVVNGNPAIERGWGGASVASTWSRYLAPLIEFLTSSHHTAG